MIEKKITQIWIGPYQPPLQWMNTWKDKHPDWEYKIFTDDMLKQRTFRNQKLIDRYYYTRKWCGVSDLIRYELIYEEGGFWPEADMVCLNNCEELFDSPDNFAYTCFENSKHTDPNYKNFVQPIMAANPGNKLLEDIIDDLHKLYPGQLMPEPYMSTGNKYLSRYVDRDDLRIWPSHYFIPQYYARGAEYYNGPDKVYAEHHWGSTGMPWTKQYNEGQ